MSIELSILPGYTEWKKASPDHPEFMIAFNTRIIGLVSALEIINPSVKLVDEMYIRISQNSDPEDYKGYSGSSLPPSEIESRVNRLRIKDLFQHDPSTDELGSELLAYFAIEVKKYWDFNLKNNLPDRNFIVLILDPEVDPEVTFFLVRDEE